MPGLLPAIFFGSRMPLRRFSLPRERRNRPPQRRADFGVFHHMETPPPDANDGLRPIVVVPLVLVCLGVAWLLFFPKTAREEAPPGPTPSGGDIEASFTPSTNGAALVARRSATFSFAKPPQSPGMATHSAEQSSLLPPVPQETASAARSGGVSAPPAGDDEIVLVPAGAEISGTVTLRGTPPPEITIDMSADPKCGALHPSPKKTRHYVVGENGGLANVFVYVKSGLEGHAFPIPAESPLLDQVDCVYEPYVMGVMVNQKFRIKNSDPFLHNVHPTPRFNKEFNFAQPLKDQVMERSFDKREVLVRFKCDVHPWMFAYVGVLEHPYFAVTREDGTYRFPAGLPRGGRYEIEAFHVKAGSAVRIVAAGAQRGEIVDFVLEVPHSP